MPGAVEARLYSSIYVKASGRGIDQAGKDKIFGRKTDRAGVVACADVAYQSHFFRKTIFRGQGETESFFYIARSVWLVNELRVGVEE